jgi:hypothetical protein
MSYGKKYQCDTANGAIPYYFKGYYCGIYMNAQKGGMISPLQARYESLVTKITYSCDGIFPGAN